jgi:peptide deformylase
VAAYPAGRFAAIMQWGIFPGAAIVTLLEAGGHCPAEGGALNLARMAVLKIARMGHPVLLEQCRPVPDPGAPEIRRLVQDMFDTMEDAPGAGLAAPQVRVPLRLFVFRVLPERATGVPGDVPVGNTVLINPEVEPLGEEKHLRWEGCLSIPGLRAAVPRFMRVRYTGLDCDGRTVTAEVGGFHAGVVQHENDHLNGILYPMRMTDFGLMGFNEELARSAELETQAAAARARWAGPSRD